MGNTAVKDKGRHISGDDTGPMMSTPRHGEDYVFSTGSLDDSGEFGSGTFRVSYDFLLQ